MIRSLAVCAMLIATGLAIAYVIGQSDDPEPSAVIGAQPVDAQSECVQGMGYVEPRTELRRLSFEIDGLIDEVPVTPGQQVAAGEVLARLQTDRHRADVAVAKADLQLAKAELAQLLAGSHPDEIVVAEKLLELRREQLDHVVRERKRTIALISQNAATEIQIDDAETAVRQGELFVQQQDAALAALRNSVRGTDVQLAEARVRRADAHLSLAEHRLQLCELTAPRDGTVLQILKHPGDVLRMGDAQPVLLFGDISELAVRAEIDERYVRLIRIGQPVDVFGANLGEQRCSGTVSNVNDVMGAKTVFSLASRERKDLDVVEIQIDMGDDFRAPVGLRVDVAIHVTAGGESSESDPVITPVSSIPSTP